MASRSPQESVSAPEAHRPFALRQAWRSVLPADLPREKAERATQILEEKEIFEQLGVILEHGVPRDEKSRLVALLVRDVVPPLSAVFALPLVALQRWLSICCPNERATGEQAPTRDWARRAAGSDRATRDRPRENINPEKESVARQKDAVLSALDRDREDLARRFADDLARSQALAGRPDLAAKTLSDLARFAELRRRRTIAAEWLERAIAYNARDPIPVAQLGALRRRQNGASTFAQQSAAYVQRFPGNRVTLTSHAEVLRSAGRFEEALRGYDAVLAQFPDEIFALNGKGLALRALGRLEEAERAFGDALARFPVNVFALTGLASIHRAKGDLPRALEAYDRVVSIEPTCTLARNRRAETVRSLGRLDEALAIFDETIALAPEDTFARTGRARVLLALGQVETAIREVDAAAHRSPADVYSKLAHGELLLIARRPEEALSVYRSIRHTRHEGEARTGVGLALLALGRLDDAAAQFSARHGARSESDWLSELGLGLVHLRRGDHETAIVTFETSAKKVFGERRDRFVTAALIARVHWDQKKILHSEQPCTAPDHEVARAARRLVLAHADVQSNRFASAQRRLDEPSPLRYPALEAVRELLRRRLGGARCSHQASGLFQSEIELLFL